MLHRFKVKRKNKLLILPKLLFHSVKFDACNLTQNLANATDKCNMNEIFSNGGCGTSLI